MKNRAKYNTKHYPIHIRAMRSLFPLMERVTPFITNKLAHKFFFYPVEYPYPEIELEWIKKAEIDTFDFEGDQLNLYHWGDKTSEKKILLVHGWAGRATQFWKIIEALLKEDYHIISFDSPGHGKSEGETTHLPEMSSIINILRARFHFKYICGHSLGGAACIYALKHQPETVKKLVLISAPTKASLMLEDFLYKINAGDRSKGYVKRMVKNNFGHPLKHYFPESILPLPHFPSTLAFHDHGDSEVSFEHLNVLRKTLDDIKIVETDNLGHTKILRKDVVIGQLIKFLD